MNHYEKMIENQNAKLKECENCVKNETQSNIYIYIYIYIY